MKKFENIETAFNWAFSEKEDFIKIKNRFNLSDEVSSISEVSTEISENAMEEYLLANSYVQKLGKLYVYKY